MRQAGILAEGCLFALDHHLERLEQDHLQANLLATGLDHGALRVNHPVETNIVIMDVAGAGNDLLLLQHLKNSGVLALGFGPGRVRLIPNLDTSDADAHRVLDVLNSFAGEVN